VSGYLADRGGPYVNGSVRHAPSGAPATIVVLVGPAPTSTTTTAPPTSVPKSTARTLPQTGEGSRPVLVLALAMALAMALVAAGFVLRMR
jgi:LPXTG-motif cell wall-anchored protein